MLSGCDGKSEKNLCIIAASGELVGVIILDCCQEEPLKWKV